MGDGLLLMNDLGVAKTGVIPAFLLTYMSIILSTDCRFDDSSDEGLYRFSISLILTQISHGQGEVQERVCWPI